MARNTRINHRIKAKEVRVIGPTGENFGVLSLSDALKKAEELGLDLIEISPNVNPPVAKICDYGKFQYAEQKKEKVARTKRHIVEVKSVQVKIGTGEHDLELKAKKVSEWLKNGNRVRITLFLPGRSKYLNTTFLKERIERLLRFLTEEYRIIEPIAKSPKGLSTFVEQAKK
ncbi:MAG: translation initiation factor IF-3 [Candidatus Pacebacteria bacterium]|nr:translation initiation factor IF-3 [Candidatus Paceibacterota bacterium]